MEKNIIDTIMLESGITKYTINDDLSIDINENLDLNDDQSIIQYMIMGEIKLNTINGDFSAVFRGDLTNVSMPKIVNGDFDISFSNFQTLERCPEFVKGDYNCSFNELNTLKGCVKVINGDFNCSMNFLTTMEHGPHTVSNHVDLSHNELTDLKHMPYAKDYYTHSNTFEVEVNDDNIHQLLRTYKILDILE